MAFGSDAFVFFPPLELLLNCMLRMELLLHSPITVLVLCFQQGGPVAILVTDDRAMFATSCLRMIRATAIDIELMILAHTQTGDWVERPSFPNDNRQLTNAICDTVPTPVRS